MKKQKRNDKSLRSNWLPLAIVSILVVGMVGLIGRSVYKESKTKAELAEEKTKFRQEFPGLEGADALPMNKKQEIIEIANREFCPCKCGYTLASCLVADKQCPNRQKNLLRIKELICLPL